MSEILYSEFSTAVFQKKINHNIFLYCLSLIFLTYLFCVSSFFKRDGRIFLLSCVEQSYTASLPWSLTDDGIEDSLVWNEILSSGYEEWTTGVPANDKSNPVNDFDDLVYSSRNVQDSSIESSNSTAFNSCSPFIAISVSYYRLILKKIITVGLHSFLLIWSFRMMCMELWHGMF